MYVYMAHHFILLLLNLFDLKVDREGCGLSSLCHGCGFAYLRFEYRVV